MAQGNEAPQEMTMLSIPRTLHTRIKKLAKEDGRSMRTFLDRLIAKAEQK